MSTKREIYIEHICLLEFWDVREGVTLWRVILQRLKCIRGVYINSPSPQKMTRFKKLKYVDRLFPPMSAQWSTLVSFHRCGYPPTANKKNKNKIKKERNEKKNSRVWGLWPEEFWSPTSCPFTSAVDRRSGKIIRHLCPFFPFPPPPSSSCFPH